MNHGILVMIFTHLIDALLGAYDLANFATKLIEVVSTLPMSYLHPLMGQSVLRTCPPSGIWEG